MTYPSGAKLTYHYDVAGQVSGVDLTVNGQTQSLASNLTYAPFGGIESLSYGNGLNLTQQWDRGYRMTSQSIPDILALNYTDYDGNGNLQQRDDATVPASPEASQFGYDALDRLHTASGPFGSGWSYTFGKNGNRTQTDEGSPTLLEYGPDINDPNLLDPSNRLKKIGNDDVLLDIAGNTLAKGNWTYHYTPQYRLQEAFDNGTGVASYAYNGLGQRVEKNPTASYDKRFYYGQNGALLVETEVHGYPLVEYFYLNGQLLALYQPDSDANGQTNLQAAESGVPVVPPDTDGDGLTDDQELQVYGTSPTNPDTDGDGVNDGDEVQYNTDPNDPNDFLLPGDINLDGQVDLRDYLLLTQFIAGTRTPTPTEQQSADLNQNGQLDAGDAVVLMRKIMRLAWNDFTHSLFSQTLLAAWDGLIHTAEAAVTPGALYYVHNDHLGTPQVMTDENANVVWKASYDPFGKATVAVNTQTLNIRFPGQYYDQETGLHYNYFRFYDPETGRYLASDPIGLEGGLNTYVYADSNPVNYSDSSGLLLDAFADALFIVYDLYRIGADNVFGNCDNFGTNSAALGADIGGLFLPGATGLGLGIRVTKNSGQAVVRTTRGGDKAVRITRPDGSVIDISTKRVKEFVPNTHPNAPPGALNRVKFDNALLGSKGFKRAPTQQELDILKKAK